MLLFGRRVISRRVTLVSGIVVLAIGELGMHRQCTVTDSMQIGPADGSLLCYTGTALFGLVADLRSRTVFISVCMTLRLIEGARHVHAALPC